MMARHHHISQQSPHSKQTNFSDARFCISSGAERNLNLLNLKFKKRHMKNAPWTHTDTQNKQIQLKKMCELLYKFLLQQSKA